MTAHRQKTYKRRSGGGFFLGENLSSTDYITRVKLGLTLFTLSMFISHKNAVEHDTSVILFNLIFMLI